MGRKGRLHQYNGKAMTIKEISLITGIAPMSIRDRLKMGWDLERAAETPIRDNPLSAATAKIPPKPKKLKVFATCSLRCNPK